MRALAVGSALLAMPALSSLAVAQATGGSASHPPGQPGAAAAVHPAKSTDGADAAKFPKLTAMDQQKLERLLEGLKTKNQADRDAKEAEIVKLGRGIIPTLVAKAHDQHKLQAPALVDAIDKLTGEPDFAFIQGLLRDPAPIVRGFAVRKLAALRPKQPGEDKVLVDLLVPVLNDADADVKLGAALALADQHRPDGLLVLIDALKSDDKQKQAQVEAALPKLKDRNAHGLVEAELTGKAKDADRRMLVLRAVGMIGDPKSGPLLAQSLEESNSRIQETTVNALRRAMDGAAPLEFATVFDLVKEVEAWKKRLGSK